MISLAADVLVGQVIRRDIIPLVSLLNLSFIND